MQDTLMDIRASLATGTNVTGGVAGVGGGAEIQKKIDTMIVDTINRGVDLRPLVSRKPTNQLTYFWVLRKDLQSTNSVVFQSTEGASGTPYYSTKYQCYAQCKSLRSDYEVSNLMIAGSSSFYDALADEAQCALDSLKLYEERCMISGDETTGGYGLANSYIGLYDALRWHTSNGGDTEATAAHRMQSTTARYGLTPASGTTHLDVSYVVAGTAGTATGVLELPHLNESITRSNKHGGKGHDRIFFCSEERVNEINELLQPQQRFAGTLNLEGGFTISTYKGIPIVGSRFMDLAGLTNTTSASAGAVAESAGDNAMYLLDMDRIEFRVLNGVDTQHVSVINHQHGATDYGRSDTSGGFFKIYGTFVVKSFNSHVVIWNLTAP